MKEVKKLAMLLFKAEFCFQTLKDAHTIANFLAHACPNPRLAIVGITEIFVNAIEHGNLGISFEEKSKLQGQKAWIKEIERRLKLPENRDKFVNVHFKKTKRKIQIRVKDQGAGFNWQKFEGLNNEHIKDPHGRGIMVAKKLAFSHLKFLKKGNEVLCVITL